MAAMRMKKYATFDLWAADRAAKFQPVIGALRKLVKGTSPSLVESVKWGNGCWLAKEVPVAYLHAEQDHLQFGFFNGSALSDRKGLLIGNGKYVRHVKLRSLEDIDSAALARWIRQASKRKPALR